MIDFDFHNLPEDNTEIEALIRKLSGDEVLMHLNIARQWATETTDTSDMTKARVGILLTRRLREIRESSRRGGSAKAAPKEPKTVPSLADLL